MREFIVATGMLAGSFGVLWVVLSLISQVTAVGVIR